MKVNLNDKLMDLPTKRTFKDSGQMIAPVTIARTGIMEYRAKDCGTMFADRDPESTVKIMTEAADLFDEKSLASYRSAPITVGHPEVDVTVENASTLQKGSLEGMPFKDEADAELLAGTIVLNDGTTIDLVESGTSQLSSGHSCTLVLADEADDFDAKKTEIRANHIAIVRKGRAGSATIADEAEVVEEETTTMFDQDFVDGLQAKLEAKDEELTSVKAELADAVTNLEDEDYIRVRVEERLAFITQAAQFTDADIVSLSEVETMRLILKDHISKDLTEKSEAHVRMRYEILLEDGVDEDGSITQALRDHAGSVEPKQPQISPAESARAAMIARNS